jgi:ATP-dependent DNA helicase RecQ
LRAWQLAEARESGKAPFFVFPLSVLKQIAALRPSTLDELAEIKGVGPVKLKRYGPEILRILSSFRHN